MSGPSRQNSEEEEKPRRATPRMHLALVVGLCGNGHRIRPSGSHNRTVGSILAPLTSNFSDKSQALGPRPQKGDPAPVSHCDPRKSRQRSSRERDNFRHRSYGRAPTFTSRPLVLGLCGSGHRIRPSGSHNRTVESILALLTSNFSEFQPDKSTHRPVTESYKQA